MPDKRPGNKHHPDASGHDAADEQPGVLGTVDAAAGKAEVASAAMVVQALVKADRGFSIYLPNNPLHEKFFEDFRRRAEEHLEEFGPLRLGLTHESILCCGETIYSNPELRENLAFRLYADGIRSLKIDEGVEPPELRALVEIFGRPAADLDEDDIVTRLWSSDLPHVTYVLADTLPESSAALGSAMISSREAQEGALRRYAAELTDTPTTTLPPPPAKQVFNLSEEEIRVLHELLAEEERRTPFEDMVGILEAVIAAEAEDAVLEEFLEIVARLCGDLMLTGRLPEAVDLLYMLSRTATRPGLRPGCAAKIDATRARVLTADVLEGLFRLLTTGLGIERDRLRKLVVGIGRSAIEPFCRILGDVPDKETRKAIIEALADVGRDSPELFLPFLLDARWYLVRNTIYILRRIAGPEAARAVARCADNRDARVRKEVLHYFDETGDPAGEPVLLSYLDDEQQSLRLGAARGLARRGSRDAAERLLGLTASRSFAALERTEREAIWEALGVLAPATVFPKFRSMLLKRHWLGRIKDVDDTACACAGLRYIGTPEATEVLRQAAEKKRGEAREIVEKALRARELGQGMAGRAGNEAGGGKDDRD